MADEKEAFLDRWSRLKRDSAQEKEEESAKPSLPPVDKLTPESDFTGFMHPKVEDALRRVALKKLFSDPHFNVADPFEAYSGDWTGGEPIPEEMLAALNQAKQLLFDEKKDEKKETGQEVASDQKEKTQSDDPGRKDA